MQNVGLVNSMWITGTITRIANPTRFAGRFQALTRFAGRSQSPTKSGTDLQTEEGPGNFASLFGRLMTGVSVPDIYIERERFHCIGLR